MKLWAILAALLCLRVCIGLLPYSGFKNPPKHGDYEAQRNWMAITTSIPLSQWYFPTEENDLQYWGLDYPPLTAYHSFLCGKLSRWYEPASMELSTSRGYETVSHKHFMRGMVIVADLLLLIPAIWYTVSVFYRRESLNRRLIAFVALVGQPGLLLIDHGHFQFNGISLGLAVLAIGLILDQHDILASIAFSLSLNYKQMSLYYAAAFFFALLAKSTSNHIFSAESIKRLSLIGFTVAATFLLCWLPFLLQNDPQSQVTQLLHRIFPVARGLYEDKVANLWCSISPVFKLQNFASPAAMMKICTIMTLLGMTPACFAIVKAFWKKSASASSTFVVALSSIAWSFFFFSYHVHEKSVLLPVFMMSLWILKSPNIVVTANVVSTISMLPLLQRDGHEYSLLVLTVLYLILAKLAFRADLSLALVSAAALLPFSFHLLSKLILPPSQYPDLLVLLLTASSFAIMALCFLHLHLQLYLLDSFGDLESAVSAKRKQD